MKVAVVVEWLDAWRGGAERSTLQFIHHLVEQDIAVEVFTRSNVPGRPGLTVTGVLGRRSDQRRNTADFCSAVEETIDPGRYEVIHAIVPMASTTVYEPRGGTYAETLARNIALRTSPTGQSVKWLTQKLNRKAQLMLARERALLSRRDPPLVIALSDYVVRQLREHYDFPPARIRRVFNGVDPDLADEATRAQDREEVRALYGIGPGELLLLSVAHNFKLKGVRSLIEALALLHKEGRLSHWRSVVVGKGRAAPWQRRAAARGVGERIQFPGPTQRIAAFLHAADVLVHPTFYDPCSRVVLEALTAGLPCITTRYDGAADVLTDGVDGYVLESPADIEALASRIEALADPARRSGFAASIAKLGEQVTMRRHTEALIEIYQTVAGGVARP